MLVLLLSACLIQDDAYQENLDRLTDGDGDSYLPADDCDDGDGAVHPGADERCNGADDDCDGQTDDDAVDATTWYSDDDGDGYGDPAASSQACAVPDGSVGNSSDCDDSDGDSHPGGTEVAYDGRDNDCLDGDLVDADLDGATASAAGGDDCDDQDPSVYPGASETWDNGATDNDCDGDYGAATLEYGAEAWTGEAAGDNAGRRITALGDIDGDGLAEFAVGAIYQSEVYSYGGAIYIVSGGEPGPLADEGVLRPGGATWILGGALDGGTDIDGDGVPDLLTGASNYGDGDGAVWLLSGANLPEEGSEATLTDHSAWEVLGNEDSAYLGSAVAFVGDIDGDGRQDVAASASYADVGGFVDAGRVGIWTSVEGGATLEGADVVVDGFFDGAKFGSTIEPAGDQDEDGYDDVLVGYGAGVVAGVLPGGGGGSIHAEDDAIVSLYLTDQSDTAFASMTGDIDGDGALDVAVVVNTYDTYIFTDLRGSPARDPTNARALIAMDGDSFVFDLCDAGDLDGDGLAETVLPAKWYEPAGVAQAVLLFGATLAPAAELSFAEVDLRVTSERASADFGYRVARVGDIDGDGNDEILMAGAGDDVKGVDAGAVATFNLPH